MYNPPNIGPQKGPSSTSKISAEVKSFLKALEEVIKKPGPTVTIDSLSNSKNAPNSNLPNFQGP